MVQSVSDECATDREQESADSMPDHTLLERFRHGNKDAATLLYLRYADRLRALAARQSSPDLARRVDPDDIVQTVFRTFFRRAAEGQYDVPAGEDLWKLFLVIALNKIRAAGAHHRAAKRDVRATAGGAVFEHAIESEQARDETALTVLRLVIDEVLGGLSDSQRRIVELRIQEFEVAEIAERTGRSKRTVERVLQEFRKRLSAILTEDGEYAEQAR